MQHTKQYAAIAATMLLLSACKKEDEAGEPAPNPAGPDISDYSNLVVGNFWVYEVLDLDSTGAYTGTPAEYDSVYVHGDTIINGVTWTELRSTPGGTFQPKFWRRDSLDYLVDLYNGPIFLASTSDALVEHEEYPGLIAIDYNLLASLQPINVPLGTFDCQEVKGVVTSLGGPVPPDHRLTRNHWSEGVGLVHSRVFYYLNGSGYETRLVSYHVQ